MKINLMFGMIFCSFILQTLPMFFVAKTKSAIKLCKSQSTTCARSLSFPLPSYIPHPRSKQDKINKKLEELYSQWLREKMGVLINCDIEKIPCHIMRARFFNIVADENCNETSVKFSCCSRLRREKPNSLRDLAKQITACRSCTKKLLGDF